MPAIGCQPKPPSLAMLTLTALVGCHTSTSLPTDNGNNVSVDGAGPVAVITADRSSAVADGHDGIHITVQITEDGQPWSGFYVDVGISGTGSRWTSENTTDMNGIVTGTLTSTQPGSKAMSLTASGYLWDIVGASVTIVSPPELEFIEPTLSTQNLAITVNRDRCNADGRCEITAVANVQDTLGNPMPNAQLSLVVSGSGNKVDGGHLSGLMGQTVSRISSTVAETKTLTATFTYQRQSVTSVPISVAYVDGSSVLATCANGLLVPGHPLLWPTTVSAALAGGDFNGDGNQDLALTDAKDGNNLLAFGRGDGTFADPVPLSAANPILLATDVDNNGVTDLIVSTGLATFSTYLFTSAGAIASAVPGTGAPVQSALLNGDAFIDLVAISPNSISLWLGDGAGGFSSAAAVPNPIQDVEAYGVGDLNGDGFADLVAGDGNSLTLVWLNTGDASFASPVPYSNSEALGELSFADVTGDGNVDLLGQGSGRGALVVWSGGGNGTLSSNVVFYKTSAVILGQIRPLQVADINHDGHLDVVVTGSEAMSVMLGGTEGFAVNGVYDVFGIDDDITRSYVADFDRDGFADMAFAAMEGPPGLGLAMGSASGFDHMRSAGLTIDPPYISGNGPILLANLDGDGFPDLVTLGNDPTTQIANGDGTFYSTYLQDVFTDGPVPAVVGDFTGDGLDDLFTGDGNILMSLGDGTMQLIESAPLFIDTAQQLLAADFNQDGRLDIAIVDIGEFGTIDIYPGDGRGRFGAEPWSVPVPTQGCCATVADLNADGRVDLLVASTSGYLSPIINAGGNFTTTTLNTVYAIDNVTSLSVADFNGDGAPDALLGSEREFYIALGDGGGHYTAAGSYRVAANVNAMWHTVDLDQDGNTDVLHSSSYGYQVQAGGVDVAFGRGDGSFAPTVTYAPTLATSSATGDFNGDGRPDVAVMFDDYVTETLLNKGCF